jgi:hypothetical protein
MELVWRARFPEFKSWFRFKIFLKYFIVKILSETIML